MRRVTPQAKWQRIQQFNGNCIRCGKPRVAGSNTRCAKHLVMARLYMRKKKGSRPWDSSMRGKGPLCPDESA